MSWFADIDASAAGTRSERAVSMSRRPDVLVRRHRFENVYRAHASLAHNVHTSPLIPTLGLRVRQSGQTLGVPSYSLQVAPPLRAGSASCDWKCCAPTLVTQSANSMGWWSTCCCPALAPRSGLQKKYCINQSSGPACRSCNYGANQLRP